MRNSGQQITILGLLGLVALAAVVVLAIKALSGTWAWGVQAVVLTPILLLYAFSWTVLILLAPALVSVFPGISPAAPALRWFLAVVVGAAECLFVILWMQTDSLLLLVVLGLMFSGIWMFASMALREYSEML